MTWYNVGLIRTADYLIDNQMSKCTKCFSVIHVAHHFSFLCCVFGGVRVAHLFSFLCCVFRGSVLLIFLVFCVVLLVGSVLLIFLVFCVVFLVGSVLLIFLVFYVVLFVLFVFVLCRVHMHPMLPVSLYCPLLIAPSVFSYVYLQHLSF